MKLRILISSRSRLISSVICGVLNSKNFFLASPTLLCLLPLPSAEVSYRLLFFISCCERKFPLLRSLWSSPRVSVDGAINGLAMGVIPWVTRLAGRGQSGYVFHYAFVMLIGVSILVTWLSVGGSAH